MPYVERDESGNIVCLYGALDPMFQQARNYLSTGKLQERLGEYDAVHAEAARLGLGFDEAVTDICSRWPEWLSDAELDAISDPAPSGVFDSEEPEHVASAEPVAAGPDPIEQDEVGEPDASPDAGTDEVGDDVDADFVDSSGDWGVSETDPDAGPGDPDYSVSEPVGDVASVADEPEPETVAYPGMMVTGDPLKAAKNDAREALAQKQRSILDQYPWQDNLRDFDQLQSVRWAIAEGSHPPFNDEQQAEFDSLSTFSNWFGRVNQNAFNITVQIDDAQTVEAVQAIELDEGWPE